MYPELNTYPKININPEVNRYPKVNTYNPRLTVTYPEVNTS